MIGRKVFLLIQVVLACGSSVMSDDLVFVNDELCTMSALACANPYDENAVSQIASTNTFILDECLLGLAIRYQIFSGVWSSELMGDANGNLHEMTILKQVSPPDEFERIRLAKRFLTWGANPNASVKDSKKIYYYLGGKFSNCTYVAGDSVAIAALKSGFERLASEIYNATNSHHVSLSDQKKLEAVRFAQTNSCFLFLSFIGERMIEDTPLTE